MKSNKKALIIVSSLVILGVGGYFLYTYMKKKKMEKDAKIQADLDAAKSEGQKIAEEAKADAAVAIKKAQGATELEMANTWIETTAGKDAPLLKFDDAYKIAYWKAKTSKAPTFKVGNKTFDTNTLRVYTPILSGKATLNRTASLKIDKVNARSTAGVTSNNLLGYFSGKGKSIGIVKDIKSVEDLSGRYNWYQIVPTAPLYNGIGKDISNLWKLVWVREDNVIVK